MKNYQIKQLNNLGLKNPELYTENDLLNILPKHICYYHYELINNSNVLGYITHRIIPSKSICVGQGEYIGGCNMCINHLFISKQNNLIDRIIDVLNQIINYIKNNGFNRLMIDIDVNIFNKDTFYSPYTYKIIGGSNEIIKILEHLGGKNVYNLTGTHSESCYFINHNKFIINQHIDTITDTNYLIELNEFKNKFNEHLQ